MAKKYTAKDFAPWGGEAGRYRERYFSQQGKRYKAFQAWTRKKYNLSWEWNKELAKIVRDQMTIVKNDAKAIARAVGLPKLAKTISRRTRPRKTDKGVVAILTGAGWFNIWINGRKAYDIVPRNRKALKLPDGGFAKRVHIKAQPPRRVMFPAWRKNEKAVSEAVKVQMAEVTAKGLSRTIEIKAA